MTTIAYHHGDKEVSTESRITCSSEILTDKANKVFLNGFGRWFLAGSECDFISLVTAKHNDKVDPLPDCSALLIKDGACWHVTINNDGYCCHTKLSYNFTLGSGADYAIAAMDHGKSAPEAVKYAMTRDIYSGGKIRKFKV